MFSEYSGRSCQKLHIFSVFFLWFSFAKLPKYSSSWERQPLLSAFLEMDKTVICTTDKNLERIIFNPVHIAIDLSPFLIENLIHVRVVHYLSRSIEKMSGMLLWVVEHGLDALFDMCSRCVIRAGTGIRALFSYISCCCLDCIEIALPAFLAMETPCFTFTLMPLLLRCKLSQHRGDSARKRI